MEHAQRANMKPVEVWRIGIRLNPYFNGTCSKRIIIYIRKNRLSSLNPYFNGTCSKSITLSTMAY